MKKNLNSWSAATACLFIAASIAFGQDVSAPAATPPPTSIQLPSDSHDAGAPADAAVSSEANEPSAASAAAEAAPAPTTTEAEVSAAPTATETNAEAEPAPVIEVPTDNEDANAGISQSSDTDNRISVTLDNVPLQDVVRMFTRISGANIVSGTNLSGNVTVNLQDVEWEPALRVILDSTGNALVEKTPGIYTIVNKNDLAAEPVTSDTIFLSFATVSNILPLVQSMIVSTNGRASGFSGANAIIVQETITRIKTIREVVSRVDRPRDQVMIEAKFVELDDEAIKDVGIDWSVLQGYTVSVTPQYRYDSARTKVKSSDDSNSDRTTRTLTDRLTRNDTDTRRDVSQDAIVNVGNDSSGSGTTATYPGGSVTGQDRAGSSRDRIAISGENFSEYDAENNKVTLIPRRDRTLIDQAYREDNRVRTLDDLVSDGDKVTRTTTDVLSAILSAEQFSLTLSALKQNNGVEIISNPKVVVASGETALIHVGRNEPNIVAVPQGDTGDRYAYQLDERTPFIEIGVKLNVTPTYNTESNINVRITPELSRKLADKSVGEAGTSFPVTQIRKISTEFNLESGRTVAIGGLTESDDTENVKKIPVLGDIPIIGKYFFRHSHTEKRQDEVIIFVTVTSAKPSALAQISGIPEEGRLIHRHLAQRAEEAAKAEQLKTQKGTKAK